MDFIIQKAVELGVADIYPVFSERSVVRLEGDRARTPFIVMQTIGSQPPETLATGCYHDTLATTADGLRLAARNAVYDNALIPNSLVYPL